MGDHLNARFFTVDSGFKELMKHSVRLHGRLVWDLDHKWPVVVLIINYTEPSFKFLLEC